jgi:hypothetical protein
VAGQESLGVAVLRLEVDDTALRQGVRQARQFVDRELTGRTTGTASPGNRAANATRLQQEKDLLRVLERQITAQRQLAAATKQRQTSQQRQQGDGGGRLNSALIGGAFPLLFGQGGGASVGGALGGALGGSKLGFGLSLVGTLLGSAFDTAIQKAQTLAAALDDPIAQFDALVQNASLSSKALENYAKALIATGRTDEAAALIRSDILGTVGSEQGVEAYRKAVDELSRSFSSATTILASFVAGPLAELIAKLTGPTTGIGVAVRYEQLVGQLTPGQREQVVRARDAATEQARKSRGGISAILPPSEDDVTAGRKAGIVVAEKLLGVGQQRAKAEQDLLSAATRNREIQSAGLQLAVAQLNNDKLSALEAQKRILSLEKERELLSLPAKAPAPLVDAINIKFKKESLRLEKELSREIQRRSNLSRQVTEAAGAFGRTDAAQVAVDVGARLRETLLQFGPASLELQLALQQGANALLDASRSAGERLRDAVRSFRDLQQGNLRFLRPADRQRVIEDAKRTGLPEAARRGVALRGVEDLFGFNKFLEQETAARQELVDANRNMLAANDNLRNSIVEQTGAATTLTEVMNRLVDKSWAVYVQVPGQNAAGAINLQTQLS